MILDLHRQGAGVSAIARRTGLDRKTVRKVIAGGLEPPIYGPRPRSFAEWGEVFGDPVVATRQPDGVRETKSRRVILHAIRAIPECYVCRWSAALCMSIRINPSPPGGLAGLLRHRALAPSTPPAQSRAQLVAGRPRFLHPAVDRAAGQNSCYRRSRDTAMAQRQRFVGRE
jgi:hypothetical protein